MRWAAVVLVVAGCDKVLGLTEKQPVPADAAVVDHDEDQDLIEDSEDLCPTINNPTLPQPDGDGDKVGDACDPHPTEAIDRRAYFSPLVEFPAGEWVPIGGSWMLDNDGVRQTLPDASDAYARLDIGRFRAPTVEVIVDAITTGGVGDAGVHLARNRSFEGGACYVQIPTNAIIFFALTGGNGSEMTGPIFQAGDEIRLTMHSNVGGKPRCDVRRGTQDVRYQPPVAAPLAEVEVHLYTFRAAATFHSLFIVDSL